VLRQIHQKLTDEELLDRLAAAAALERQATANLIALLAEMDTRGLYLARGYSSLFAYCTRSLHLWHPYSSCVRGGPARGVEAR
jgi:hypothetical protein